MGRKTPISFNLRKLIAPDLIDFFGDDWKEIKTQTEKRNIHNFKKYCTD